MREIVCEFIRKTGFVTTVWYYRYLWQFIVLLLCHPRQMRVHCFVIAALAIVLHLFVVTFVNNIFKLPVNFPNVTPLHEFTQRN